MTKIKITKRTVEALKVAAKDYIAFDTDLPGFGVRVMPSGKRFFLVQYRCHGRTRRVMIGQFGIVTAELARREATIKLGSVRGADGDPAALRDADRQSTTMKELGERFLNQYVPVRCKPSTQAEYRRSVELFLDPFFSKQRVRSVTTTDVAELHGSLAHIPYQANRTGRSVENDESCRDLGDAGQAQQSLRGYRTLSRTQTREVLVSEGTATSWTGVDSCGGKRDGNQICRCCFPHPAPDGAPFV